MARVISEYKGCTFPELLRIPNIEGDVAWGGERCIFKEGTFSIDSNPGSWKFGEQILIQLWGKGDPVECPRAQNNGWWRIVIAIPKKRVPKPLLEVLEAPNKLESFM